MQPAYAIELHDAHAIIQETGCDAANLSGFPHLSGRSWLIPTDVVAGFAEAMGRLFVPTTNEAYYEICEGRAVVDDHGVITDIVVEHLTSDHIVIAYTLNQPDVDPQRVKLSYCGSFTIWWK